MMPIHHWVPLPLPLFFHAPRLSTSVAFLDTHSVRCGHFQVTKGAGGRSERGSYLFFDTSIWDVVQKADVEISFDDVEMPARLPRPKHLNAVL